MTNETPALGICLEEYEYPYPVEFLPITSDLQPLKMAYMDIPHLEVPDQFLAEFLPFLGS